MRRDLVKGISRHAIKCASFDKAIRSRVHVFKTDSLTLIIDSVSSLPLLESELVSPSLSFKCDRIVSMKCATTFPYSDSISGDATCVLLFSLPASVLFSKAAANCACDFNRDVAMRFCRLLFAPIYSTEMQDEA